MKRHPLSNQKGITAIHALVIMTCVFPMLIFAAIDLPYAMENHRQLKNAVDNAASSAAYSYDKAELSQGRIALIPSEAELVANKLIAANLALDEETMEPVLGSLAESKPRISVLVANQKPDGSFEVTIKNNIGVFTNVRKWDNGAGIVVDTEMQPVIIQETTVLVYLETETHGLFMNFFNPVFKYVGAAQAQFNPNAIP